tara:strand:+ start:3859 stop:5535 length:1677 start_codon:yes stop_codon:yes gene_type:complete
VGDVQAMKGKFLSSSGQPGNVEFNGRLCALRVGKTIFDHADELRVKVPTSCGRVGTCHECVVQIRKGDEALRARSDAEAFLQGDYRLACQAVVEQENQEIAFDLLRREPKILLSQESRAVDVDPMVHRQGDKVYYGSEELDRYRGHLYGVALDLGTTTVVLELVNLETGQSVHVESFENPQRFGGSDIMTRISYDGGEHKGELHTAIVNTFNTVVREFCAKLGVSRHEIYEILVVGNTTMRDLFFGLDVQSIGQKPYRSNVEEEHLRGVRKSTGLRESARQLKLMANRNAVVCGVPLIGSHVGGDIVADLVAIDMVSRREPVMLVDVGTNTEVVLGYAGRLMAASCPAGPAFEGGLVRFGMPGCEGAVESVRYRDGKFCCETIGEGEPEGICGSGFIDLLAELRRANLMTPKGVFPDKAVEVQVVQERGITLSRQDVSELAQAKAASFCGQAILMRQFGVSPDEISQMFLSGGFVNYVEVASAVDIGFLAPVNEDRVIKVGNAAAQGAREMLLSRKKRSEIAELISRVEHVELETTEDFFEMFVEGCQFKPMNCQSLW